MAAFWNFDSKTGLQTAMLLKTRTIITSLPSHSPFLELGIQAQHLRVPFHCAFSKTDSDGQTKSEFDGIWIQCQASGPYQMFEFLGDMVLFEQNQSTKVPHADGPGWSGLRHVPCFVSANA